MGGGEGEEAMSSGMSVIKRAMIFILSWFGTGHTVKGLK